METKLCLQCGKIYTGRGIKFCSNSCKMRYRNLTDNVAKRPEVRAKISEQARATNRQEQLMTRAARQKAIPKISKSLTGKKLTEAHKKAIGIGSKRAGCKPPDNSKALVGANHPNWKGGTSTLRNKDHNSPTYIAFRKAVIIRDNWTCQKCGKRGGKLQAHHIKSWAEYPELRYDVKNGITLCVHCHHLAHKGVQRPLASGSRTLSDLL